MLSQTPTFYPSARAIARHPLIAIARHPLIVWRKVDVCDPWSDFLRKLATRGGGTGPDMSNNEVRQRLEERFHEWALNDFQREVAEDFPFLRRVAWSIPIKVIAIMRSLPFEARQQHLRDVFCLPVEDPFCVAFELRTGQHTQHEHERGKSRTDKK